MGFFERKRRAKTQNEPVGFPARSCVNNCKKNTSQHFCQCERWLYHLKDDCVFPVHSSSKSEKLINFSGFSVKSRPFQSCSRGVDRYISVSRNWFSNICYCKDCDLGKDCNEPIPFLERKKNLWKEICFFCCCSISINILRENNP